MGTSSRRRRGRPGRGAALVAIVLAAQVAAAAAGPWGAPAAGAGAVAAVQAGGGTRPVVVRGSSWFVRDSLTGGIADHTFAYGQAGDVQLMGDWDGDGEVTPGVVRGSTWMLRNSLDAGPPDISFSYGFPGDYPVVGDWDGNGTDTPGVVRGSTWFLKNSNSSPGVADVSFAFGFASDLAVAGDWDGDGRSTPGVVRGTTWFLRTTNDPANTATAAPFDFGEASDQRLVGDWDGDGTTTVGGKRRSAWILRNSNSAGPADLTFSYGLGCDLGFAAPGTISRGRGGKGLPAALRGTELSVVATTRQVVALTFDAGANAAAVPSILSTLEAGCVPATFFLTGDWVDAFPAEARRIAVRYPVGNHSDTHPHLPALSDAAVRDQINRAERIIQGSTKFNARPMFRFPFGERDDRTMRIVNGLRYGSIRWTVDTLGWQGTSGGQSVQTVTNRVLANLRPGEIVLMHVGSHPTDGSTLDADALPGIVAELKRRGYGFVTIYDSI
jgi:peptidoglycan/xylan/chitin deacetylase (PgdA/CDA1 family)